MKSIETLTTYFGTVCHGKLLGMNRHADIRKICEKKLQDVPFIPNIHQAVYRAATSHDTAFDMTNWHKCETTHCRAGWVITLAGDAGKRLERQFGTAISALLIYAKSDPDFSEIPNFYTTDENALRSMHRAAQNEIARNQTVRELELA
jgi:hypothetical protein